jgi:hypothetical protein
MTYYLKYLKYKNKYLELKKLIGGAKKLDLKTIQKLWAEMIKKNKVYEVLDNDKDIFDNYCWIGSPSSDPYDNGYGFFIYSIKKAQTGNNKLDKFEKYDGFAIKILEKKNLDRVYPYGDFNNAKFNFTSAYDIFGEEEDTNNQECEGEEGNETCFSKVKNVVKIPKGTPCDWFQIVAKDKSIFKGWICNSEPVQYILYKPDN